MLVNQSLCMLQQGSNSSARKPESVVWLDDSEMTGDFSVSKTIFHSPLFFFWVQTHTKTPTCGLARTAPYGLPQKKTEQSCLMRLGVVSHNSPVDSSKYSFPLSFGISHLKIESGEACKVAGNLQQAERGLSSSSSGNGAAA